MVKQLSKADQTITVDAAIPLAELAAVLAEIGMGLPFGFDPFRPVTLKEALEWGRPHTLEAQGGAWRDWVLGAEFLAGNGIAFRAGAKVVKSVAGYDLHRFLVGCRGLGAEWREVTLRLSPLRAIAEPVAEIRSDQTPSVITRVPHSRFAEVNESAAIIVADPASSTFWSSESLGSGFGWEWDIREPFVPAARSQRLFDWLDPDNRLRVFRGSEP